MSATFHVLWNVGKDTVIKRLPGWALRRLLKAGDIQNGLEVRLEANRPITLPSQSYDLTFYLWFTNHCPIEVVVDRIHLQFWLGQPVVNKGHTERFALAPHTSQLRALSFDLTDNQARAFTERLGPNRMMQAGSPSLNVKCQLDTAIGWVDKLTTINYEGAIY